MPRAPRLAAIAGSRRTAVADPPVGAADPAERASVSVYVRRRGPAPRPGGLTRGQFAAAHGADPADLDTVTTFARSAGLSVAEVSSARRRIELAGTLGALAAAFGTTLTRHRGADGATYRARRGELLVPSALAAVVTGAFGLDDRPQARAFFRPRTTATYQYTPGQVALAYDFPPGATGAGECVALIELGGGYREEDLAAYFTALAAPAPSVEAVSVDGATNAPSTMDSADGEVMLDIEIAGAIAPKAKIVVYFTSNTSQGFLDAITQAVHDTVNKPSVISISWAGPSQAGPLRRCSNLMKRFRPRPPWGSPSRSPRVTMGRATA